MSDVEVLAAKIVELEERLNALSSSERLKHTSLEDGSFSEYDIDGNLVARVGKQHDGTHGAATLNGPVPPTPAAPTLTGGPASLTVAYDGRYADPEARAPLDLHVTEIYAAPQPFSTTADASHLGSFPDEAGGAVTIACSPGTWYVALVAKSVPGRRSSMSEVVSGEALGIADAADLSERFAMLDRMLRTSIAEPTLADGEDTPTGAWWTQIDDDGEEIARWRWDGTAWLPMPLSPVAFPEVYISKLVADQAGFNQAVAQQMFAVFSSTDETGRASMLTDRGLLVTHPDGSTAISFGTWGDDFLNLYPEDGGPGVSIDNQGGVYGVSASFSSFRYKGVELSEALGAGGRGLVAWGGAGAGQFTPLPGAGEYELGELAADMKPTEQRLWWLIVSQLLCTSEGSGHVGVRLRWTVDGSAPTTSSPELGYDQRTVSGTSFVTFALPLRPIFALPGQTVRILATLYSTGPSLTPTNSPGNALWMMLHDLGEVPEQSFAIRTPAAPPPAVKKRHVDIPFNYAWHRTFEQGGAYPSAAQTAVRQGYTPHYPSAGIYRSMVGFNSMLSSLSGAEIENIQVRIRAEGWHYHSGGHVHIGLHGWADAPGSFSEVVHDVAQAKLGVEDSVWLTIPSTYYAGFKSGAYRGITVYRNSSDPYYYGLFTPGWFQIRATYVK